MGFRIEDAPCNKCGGNHSVWCGEAYYEATATYKYTCPVKGGDVAIRGMAAADLDVEMEAQDVVLTRV